MINLINPFSKKDKPESFTFIDRVGVAALALMCILLMFLLPWYAFEWWLGATWKSRLKFILFIVLLCMFSERLAIFAAWLNSEEQGFAGWAVSMSMSLFCIYWFCIFMRGFYRWFRTKLEGWK